MVAINTVLTCSGIERQDNKALALVGVKFKKLYKVVQFFMDILVGCTEIDK